MRPWVPGVLVVLFSVSLTGCADQLHSEVSEEVQPPPGDGPGWYRSATYEFDSDTGRWELVESEHGVGWSSDEFHERMEGRWEDLDDDR
ncbi:MAG TPA: hypothetical protein VMZ92_09295 [Planctomycetota bacterium]|nr:hypothetical protein [Planctomycetota bacterium]